MNFVKNEPVVTAASVVALIQAFLYMLVELQVITLTVNQMNAVMGFMALLIPIAAVIARQFVTTVANPKITIQNPVTGERQTVPLVPAPREDTHD